MKLGIITDSVRNEMTDIDIYTKNLCISIQKYKNIDINYLGMVNIQSLACGIPVVTTDCGAITEFIHHNYNGLVVPEKNSLALAYACLNLIKNTKLRRRLDVNGRKYVVTNFDNRKNIQLTENIILDMLAKFL